MLKERIRRVNDAEVKESRSYVLYWMQAYRRFDSNHSFDYALHLAKKYKKDLVVYEGLRMDYPWSSKRIHKFIMEGMKENEKRANELNVTYLPFVETKSNSGKGLLKKISKDAILVITDDFPCFIIPDQTNRLANKIDCALFSVDGNGVIPLSVYEKEASAARVLRIWMHKRIATYIPHFANFELKKKDIPTPQLKLKIPEEIGLKKSIEQLLDEIEFKESVDPVPNIIGGRKEALRILDEFLKSKVLRYDKDRSNPNPPEITATSGLSPYLHFGFISAEEIFWNVLNFTSKEGFSPEVLTYSKPGDRENFYSKILAANMFLDELLTWREIGYLFFWKEKPFRKDLNSLQNWVKENFKKHKKDKREFLYTLEQFEEAKTHDELWNAAQIELVKTGKMHNYMRMLWGKKVIEWSKSYEEAFEILEHLNNKYAYDGRNPNSYTGILWCFGLFDRPWFPERNVLGNVRYMSSDSTKKKFKMKEYLEYTKTLEGKNNTLFP